MRPGSSAKGKRLFAPLLFEGSLDSSVFNHYLKEQLLKELQPGSLSIMDNPPFTKLKKPGGALRKADTNSSFYPPILQISTPLKNTSQTSKKSGLVSHRTLPLTTLFDCTVLNGFYYKKQPAQCGHQHSREGLSRGEDGCNHAVGEEHADAHCHHKQHGAHAAAAQRGEGWSRTVATEPPADTEQQRTKHQVPVDIFSGGNLELACQYRGGKAPLNCKLEDQVTDDASNHHEGEARIPCSKDIKKADDLLGLGHAADAKSDGKQHSGAESNEVGFCHEAPQR